MRRVPEMPRPVEVRNGAVVLQAMSRPSVKQRLPGVKVAVGLIVAMLTQSFAA